MKKDIALKIENASKQYRLGLTGTGTLSHDLNRWWCKIRGKEDPYATVGVINDRSVEGGEYVWAIKDINIEVKKGEILGIIGKNGAGKSTLLKILSRITGPTTGEITMNGRMASLLEVGTGFHPELTGRENIFLNGAILGMTKSEIKEKLDEIVEFSGCAKYVDTPVKRYSSGMRVRLGFAVAAFLEPDILVVDEVLAVGDAEFQKNAIGKMKEISGSGERTVLFVSHNMASIKKLCDRVVIMDKGVVSFDGNTEDGIAKYLNLNSEISPTLIDWSNQSKRPGNSKISLLKMEIKPVNGSFLNTESDISLSITIENTLIDTKIGFNLKLLNENEILVFTAGHLIADRDSKHGIYHLELIIPKNLLNQGVYRPKIWFGSFGSLVCELDDDLFTFEVMGVQKEDEAKIELLQGVLLPNLIFSSKYIDSFS